MFSFMLKTVTDLSGSVDRTTENHFEASWHN